MSKLNLQNVTLLGIDCVNVGRLQIALDLSQKDINFGAVKLLTSLPTNDSRKVEIHHIGSIEEYSRFCIEDLYKYVDTDYVLLIQYDGFVLNLESWTDEFLNYDYIGAPWLVADWSVKQFNFPPETIGTLITGNGGFCIRSKKFLEVSSKLKKEGRIPIVNPEDVAMCVWYRDEFEKEGISFAPPNLADKFSVEYKKGGYGKPFGFHGIYQKENIDEIVLNYPDFPIYTFLHLMHKRFLVHIKDVFSKYLIEAHLIGSHARGDAENFSDIDIWLTFKDFDFEDVIKKRFELYGEVGEIIHICEPPQNAPIGGVFSTVLYKTKVGLFVVDYYLCPQSNSFITNESKTIFGNLNLPIGQTSLNTQKVLVDSSYRIDFFICFVFNSIKRIIRKESGALEPLFREYGLLSDNYKIEIKPLENKTNSFSSLEEVIENLKMVANDKQVSVLVEIQKFLNLVKQNQK